MKVTDLISHLGEKAFQDTTIKGDIFEDDVFENVVFKNVTFINCSFFNVKFINVTISENVRFDDCHFWEAKISFKKAEDSKTTDVKFIECRFGKECYISDAECAALTFESCTGYAEIPEVTMETCLLTIDRLNCTRLDFYNELALNISIQNSIIKREVSATRSVFANLEFDKCQLGYASFEFCNIYKKMLIRNCEIGSNDHFVGVVLSMSKIEKLIIVDNKVTDHLSRLVQIEYSKVSNVALPDNGDRSYTPLHLEKSDVAVLDVSSGYMIYPLVSYSDNSVNYVNFGCTAFVDKKKTCNWKDFLSSERNNLIQKM